MKAILSALLILFYFLPTARAQLYLDENYNGWLDTARIDDLSGTNKRFTDASHQFRLSAYEDITVTIKVDDTTMQGFANDSVQIHWGYQAFNLCLDLAGNRDTCFQEEITLDSVSVDSFGIMQRGRSFHDGTFMVFGGQVDTLGNSDFATQTVPFLPDWNVFIRYWAEGLAGNKILQPLRIYIDVKRRNYIRVRQK